MLGGGTAFIIAGTLAALITAYPVAIWLERFEQPLGDAFGPRWSGKPGAAARLRHSATIAIADETQDDPRTVAALKAINQPRGD